MVQVDPETRKAWREHPRTSVDLILHVEGSVQERKEKLAARGVEVKRGFRLTNTLSVRCTGETALKLLRLSWITRIEPDRAVRALGRRFP
ncbi:MAG: hypothetical protein FJZ90_09185 [Chloroflexi bacterium]|nr:hypothetical protein [Chloroflexota bacterium]